MTSATASSFVGRAEELERLLGLLDRAERGRPAVGLIAGDAGVGKTRLLTELRDVAFAEGGQVVAGHCLNFGDSALPYLPFSEVVGRLIAALAGSRLAEARRQAIEGDARHHLAQRAVERLRRERQKAVLLRHHNS